MCSSNNIATPSCGSGLCNGACNAGFSDCNGNKLADGCETNTAASTANCGACGAVCSSNNISPACAGGLCNGACNAGFADCNNNKKADGCEVNISTSAGDCGGCGLVCSSNNVSTPTCASGVCSGACTAGFADCNGDKLADGCETNIAASAANCGGCGAVCSSNNISPACTSGVCSGPCNAGFADCNNNKKADGCEINISTSPSDCGGCGTVCSSNNVAPVCASGVCVGACTAGFADCNNNKQLDGCEINTTNDRNNCGLCGHVCTALQNCVGSVCL